VTTEPATLTTIGAQPFVAGEDGPEIITSGGVTRVLPHRDYKRAVAAGSGGGAPIVVNVAGSVVTERELVDLVAEGVRDANRRQGRDTLTARTVV
jgi:hypothetical protein